MLTILYLLSSICYLTYWGKLLVKGGIPGWVYPRPFYFCVIQPGFLITDLDSNYGLIGDVVAIMLSAYVDSLGYMLSIITIGMFYGFSLPLRDNVKLKWKRPIWSPIIFCVALRIMGTLITCDNDTTIYGGTFNVFIWLIMIDISPKEIEVPAFPTAESIECSPMLGTLLWGGIGFLDERVISGSFLPFLKLINNNI